MKKVVAVAPYNHGVNFKMQVYDAWVKMGGETMPSHYPWRLFHRFAYNYELPTIPKNNDIAQLRFVEPVSLSFDTFPDYARYEIIPLVWDCWPIFFEKTCRWFVKHDVKTAIFTSSQTAERMRERFPNMNIMTITEGIDTSLYKPGKELKYRKIDLLEFGRNNGYLFKKPLPSRFNNADFYNALQDTKITICVPRCDVQPEVTGGIETLTQRYWENMLSRIIMIGRAPKELTELIGYNPVVDLNKENIYGQILDIFENIEEYQNLVNKNFDTAMKKGNWRERIIQIQKFLYNLEYK